MRIVIELKRDTIPNVVLNQLYKHTQMQTTFGVIMLALTNGAPKIMNLKELLQHFIDHRHKVIVRRTQFDLDAAQAREHILDGLKIAVDNIDEVIKIIRKSEDTPGGRCQAPQAVRLQREAERRDPQHAAGQAHRARDREAGRRAEGGPGHHQGAEEHPGVQAQADGAS